MQSRAIKAGIGYTISNILLQSIGVISLPVFTRLLTTSEYGQYSVFISYSAILLSVMGCALHASIQSANREFPGEIDQYTSSITIVYGLILLVLSIITIFVPQSVSDIMGLPQGQILLLLVYSTSTSFMNLYYSRLSLDYSYSKYLKLSIINTIGSLCLSVILMISVLNNNRLLGRILGQTLTASFVTLIAIGSLYSNAKPKYEKKYIKFGIKYSSPLVAHGIAQTILAQVDRIMIKSIVGSDEAGIYSFAGTIKTVLVVITNSLSTVWTTWYFRKFACGEIKNIQRRAKEYTYAITILVLCVLSITTELIMILGSKNFWDAKYSAIPIIIDSYILFLYQVVVQAEYYAKKTNFIFYGTCIAAVIDVITNFIFIRKFGYVAAAYTTLFSYVCYLALHIFISKKLSGFFIIPLSTIAINCLIVFLFGGVCLFFVDNLLIRMTSCFVISAFVLFYLVKMLADDQKLSISLFVKQTAEQIRSK